MFEERLDPAFNLDSVEGKLFGLGFESYTVGSHEFYFGYAMSRRILYTLDTGHYHPTETIADKISAVLMFLPEILLHVSRGVRWDSDHVVVLDDDLEAIGQELVRGGFLPRTHIGLDYFDASINRVAAWVIGTRNTLKSLLKAMLEPIALPARMRGSRATTPGAWRCRKRSGRCRGARCGITTVRWPTCRAGANGSTRCGPTRPKSCRCACERRARRQRDHTE